MVASRTGDRIAATAAELTKCGVVARELPGGIEIDGQASVPAVLSEGGADIHCYKVSANHTRLISMHA